ncbi:low temperature requirement protein A [Plantactinospora sonchi]|uniref:Low temperature requirement protein A n=1 Tax=Plantactinospora sonchi TaxID=1544735 RepID=A0ABU7RWD1_9ACTN
MFRLEHGDEFTIRRICWQTVADDGRMRGFRAWLTRRGFFRSNAPVLTEETHRTTLFEIFFDLVFVFALTRVIAFMDERLTSLRLKQGLLVLALLWVCWSNYTWLGNSARADTGRIRTGTTIAMGGVLVAALVVPNAWPPRGGPVNGPLMLVGAYIVLRVVHFVVFFSIAEESRRSALRIYLAVSVVAWVPLIVGAVLGGTVQITLWLVAILIDYAGAFLSSAFGRWTLRSPGHFTERHSLVLIIALGESLISVNAGIGLEMVRGTVILAALLGLVVTISLWRLYYENSAVAAAGVLERVHEAPRDRLAVNAYSLVHFPLVIGIIYMALGIEQVLDHLAHESAENELSWIDIAALFGGAALYLAARLIFLKVAVGYSIRWQIVMVGVAVLLIPVARSLPALAALGLLAAYLVAIVAYEGLSPPGRNPPPAFRRGT